MESKSERHHVHAKETEDIQGAQESAQASSETQASEEQSLPSDHLKHQIQARRRKRVLRWPVLDVSHLLDDWLMHERRRKRNERRG